MPDILFRNLDAETIKRLKARARRNGRSRQCEARRVLEQPAEPSIGEALEAAGKWRRTLDDRQSAPPSEDMIREDRLR